MDSTAAVSIKTSGDTWDEGVTYEAYIGRWSRPVARDFVAWLDVKAQSRWLDVGCGTGALTQVILTEAAPARVDAIDPSKGFITFARQMEKSPRANFHVADTKPLPFDDTTFDAVVAGLVLNFILEPREALREIRRVLKPGTTAAAYVWDYADGMGLIRHFWDAAVALDPKAAAVDEAHRFPLCNPVSLIALYQDRGFIEVEVRIFDVMTVFADFDDYWQPFLGGQGPAPSYLKQLPNNRQTLLRDRLRATLPFDADGSVRLNARAFAVRGKRPRRTDHMKSGRKQ
jgi:SAM-dependent methyltransferase